LVRVAVWEAEPAGVAVAVLVDLLVLAVAG